MASVHYGIGRDGRLAQYVRESDGAGGNCCLDGNYDPFWNRFGGDNLNVHTLSFETINDSANSLPLTTPQKETMFKLVNYWVHKYNIPLSNVKSHASIDAVNRSRCPGPNFPWDELFNYLKGIAKPMAPTANQIKSANDCWDSILKGLAPKGTGIYQSWLGALVSGTFYGPPLTNEYHSIDWSGQSIIVQEFARARCEWDGSPHWYGLNGSI